MNRSLNDMPSVKISVVSADELGDKILAKVEVLNIYKNLDIDEVIILIGHYKNCINAKKILHLKSVICLPFIKDINLFYRDCFIVQSLDEKSYINNIKMVVNELNQLMNNYNNIQFCYNDLLEYCSGVVYLVRENIELNEFYLNFNGLLSKLNLIDKSYFKNAIFSITSEYNLSLYTLNQCLQAVNFKLKNTDVTFITNTNKTYFENISVLLLLK